MQQRIIHPQDDALSYGTRGVVKPGVLDGVTIMRYAHIYRERESGGVEQYLRQLDYNLLQKHRLTILQMYLARSGEICDKIEVESVGRGRILWTPVPIHEIHSVLPDLPRRVRYLWTRAAQLNRQHGQRQSALLPFVRSLLQHSGGHLRNRIAILSDRLSNLLRTQHVDLLALHWLTYDAELLLSRAITARVPYVFINHFDNARLSQPLVRKWARRAAGVGTVSSRGIPDDLRMQVSCLSDAVDTEFFTPTRAQPSSSFTCPVILLPARIVAGKGHHDMIQAARLLSARKLDFVICFAGAIDSEALNQELCASAEANGLGARILFLGELSAEGMRDWYALSSVVVLPSYSEGLGRVLLEAQAMKKPAVAYDCGGTSNALLQGETGFLVEAGNVEALADKISFLLENEPERLRIGARGREFISERFGLSNLIQRHEAFYFGALSSFRESGKGISVA